MTLMYKGRVAFLGIVCFLVEEIAQSTVREPARMERTYYNHRLLMKMFKAFGEASGQAPRRTDQVVPCSVETKTV